MKLLFKIHKDSINLWQIVAFTMANIVGAAIITIGIHIYRQATLPAFGNDEIGNEYIVISKPVSGFSTLTSLIGKKKVRSFSPEDIKEVESIKGVEAVAEFSTSHFYVDAGVDLMGVSFSTSMFIESLPDDYIDLDLDGLGWKADLGSSLIPAIVPRAYLDLYNYGFAASNSLPQINEGIIEAIRADMFIYGNGQTAKYKCKIVGFTNRINSILVPQSFLEEANSKFGKVEKNGPTRLILRVDPRRYGEISNSILSMGHEIEGKTDIQARLSSGLKISMMAVTAVGLIMSGLAFILLLVSIILMIEKNRSNNETLRVLGYSSNQIAKPFQVIALVADVVSIAISCIISACVLPAIRRLFTMLQPGTKLHGPADMIVTSVVVLMILVVLHYIIIRKQTAQTYKQGSVSFLPSND